MKCETYDDAVGQFMMATMLIKSANVNKMNEEDAFKVASGFMRALNTCIEFAKKEEKLEDAENLILMREELTSTFNFGPFDSTMEDDEND